MYNTTFLCTYNLINDNTNDNTNESHTQDEHLDLTNDLYRSQILQAFNLNEWDSNQINTIFNYINEKLTKNDKGLQLLEKIKHKSYIPLEDMELILLFSYDYFYLFHNCLIDLLNTGQISDKHYNLLIQKIENN